MGRSLAATARKHSAANCGGGVPLTETYEEVETFALRDHIRNRKEEG
jgi:hypothetical protein